MADEVEVYEAPAQPATTGSRALLDNQTGLPNDVVQQVVLDHWTEVAGLQFGGPPSSFQLYAGNQGSMLARTPFRTPANVIDEIKLARDMADRDDDVAPVMQSLIALATRDGVKHLHRDERTLGFFNEIAKPAQMGLTRMLKELYREYLIASQVVTVTLFTRSQLGYWPVGTDAGRQQAQITWPVVGVLPSEDVRVLSNDLFGQGELAYKPPDAGMRDWLEEFFAQRTTPARKAEMAREMPVAAALFTEAVKVPWNDSDLFAAGQTLYRLNPRMAHRTTMPKGATAYPRPLMTRNFALLEAKRLLNIMDYALLQGGTNYIVVAKKGSDAVPAQQPEVDNLVDQVRTASRSGVLVGDHRLSIEIITPKLDELLNPAKRKLVGRKLAMAMLRIPEQVTGDPGQAGAQQEMELTAAVVMGDREDLREHIEAHIYDEIARRNSAFRQGPPKLWFPRLILGSNKDFWASIVQARDRGDIPRRWAVEALGYDYDAGVAERRREIERGDDEILTPGAVPFAGQGATGGPTDNGGGRPVGTPGNGQGANQPEPPDPAQRQRRLTAVAEEVATRWDEETAAAVRIGTLTEAVLEQYPGFEAGRLTSAERESVEQGVIFQRGPLAVVPVNAEYGCEELRVLRLEEGLSMVVGRRVSDHALVAKALCFREPHWDLLRAEETALRWGFAVPRRAPELEPELAERASVPPAPAPAAPAVDVAALAQAFADAIGNVPAPNITVQIPQPNGTVKTLRRDENGQIVEVEERPVGAGGQT